MFNEQLQECTHLVAHNMSFDEKVLGAEMIRMKMKSGNKPVKMCTKELSTDFCKLPGQRGDFKWPKLEELYKILFEEDMENAHDALGDVLSCAKCFFQLKELNIITV